MNTIPPELMPALCIDPLSWLALSLTCKELRTVKNPFICEGDDGIYEFTSTWYSFDIDLEFYGTIRLDCTNPYRAVDEYSPKYILTVPNLDGYLSYFDELPSIFPIAPPGYRWFRRSILNEKYDCVDQWDTDSDIIDVIVTGQTEFHLSVGDKKSLEHCRVKACYDIIGPPCRVTW